MPVSGVTVVVGELDLDRLGAVRERGPHAQTLANPHVRRLHERTSTFVTYRTRDGNTRFQVGLSRRGYTSPRDHHPHPERSRAPVVRKLGYRPDLDGIRGVAVLMVMLVHSAQFIPRRTWARLHAGYFGVEMFFCLSGFLITTLLLEERASVRAPELRAVLRAPRAASLPRARVRRRGRRGLRVDPRCEPAWDAVPAGGVVRPRASRTGRRSRSACSATSGRSPSRAVLPLVAGPALPPACAPDEPQAHGGSARRCRGRRGDPSGARDPRPRAEQRRLGWTAHRLGDDRQRARARPQSDDDRIRRLFADRRIVWTSVRRAVGVPRLRRGRVTGRLAGLREGPAAHRDDRVRGPDGRDGHSARGRRR